MGGGIPQVKERYSEDLGGAFKGFIANAPLDGTTEVVKGTWDADADDGKPTVTYFAFPGRAEPIKYMYYLGDVEFENKMYASYPDRAEVKAKGLIPLGNQIPTITLADGTILTQSTALFRYAGKKCGLYPENDLVAHRVDAICDAIGDIAKANGGHNKPDPSTIFGEGKKATVLMGKLESYLGDNWAVGDSMTIADVMIFVVFAMLTPKDGSDFDIVKHIEEMGFTKMVSIRKKVLEAKDTSKHYENANETFKAFAKRAGIL